jgi:hypothetical protein
MLMEFASSSPSSCFAAGVVGSAVAFGAAARGVKGDLLGVVVPASSFPRKVAGEQGESGAAVLKPGYG